jgi:transcriptional regulator with XRE-family HTH domain
VGTFEPPPSDDTSGGTSSSATPAETFAAELRALRERAGKPFRKIAHEAHFSASTLATATSGRRLPSEQVVRAFAAACGEDPDVWAAKLQHAAEAQAVSLAENGAGSKASGARAARRWYRSGRVRRTGALVVVAVALAAGMFTAGALAFGTPGSKTPASLPSTGVSRHASPIYPAPDGTDPVVGMCTSDVRLVDKSPFTYKGTTIAALELEYSPLCRAGWARVFLYPAGIKVWNMSVGSVEVLAKDGTASLFAGRLIRQLPIFTDVIQPHGGCLRAVGVLAVGTAKAVQATIPCDAVAPS